MSKPTAHNRIRPTREIGGNRLSLTALESRIIDAVALDLRSTGRGVIGGAHYGRRAESIVAHGRDVTDYYLLRRGANPFSLVINACVIAVNRRLSDVGADRKVDAEVLYEGANEKLNHPHPIVSSEPIAVYLSRLRSHHLAEEYVDANVQQSYQTVLNHLRDVPDVPSLRAARHVVSYLTFHPGLRATQQETTAMTFNAVVEGYQQAPDQGAKHPIELISTLEAATLVA